MSKIVKISSLFDTYCLPTSLTKTEILRLFQTKAEYRKDLSKVITIINSADKLFLEELNCTNYVMRNGLFQENLAELLVYLKSDATVDARSNPVHIASLFNRIFTQDDFSDFHNATPNAKNIYNSFLDNLILTFQERIKLAIDNLNTDSTIFFFDFLGYIYDENLRKLLLDYTIDSFCKLIELTSSRISDPQNFKNIISYFFSVKYIIRNNDLILSSYKHFVKTIQKNKKLYASIIIEKFEEICFPLTRSEITSLAKILSSEVLYRSDKENAELYSHQSNVEFVAHLKLTIRFLKALDIEIEHYNFIDLFIWNLEK